MPMKGRKRRPRKSAIETRKRILDVAQKMFALHGYEAVSLRKIISKARVNVAAINYYFGTKEKLFEEVLQRSVKSLNDERLRLLDECLQAASGRELLLDDVIRTYVAPFLRLHDNGGPGTATMQFLSRALNEPNPTVRNMMVKHMDPVWVRFSPVLQRLLPDLPKSSFYWRF
jgi:AcrR family transcriptional regulator